MNKKLIYVHDPMCSWCFGFAKVYQQLTEQLPENIEFIRLLGGLAPDTVEIMSESTRQMVDNVPTSPGDLSSLSCSYRRQRAGR